MNSSQKSKQQSRQGIDQGGENSPLYKYILENDHNQIGVQWQSSEN
jgi:hypothetical protein